MTPDAIIAAAVRNRAAREGQIERLRPNAAAARAKQAELDAQREALKPARQGFETMQRFKHVPNFFPTPGHIVHRMLSLAGLIPDIRDDAATCPPSSPSSPVLRVLEPSAGKGDIAHAVTRLGHLCYCVEMCEPLAEVCRKAGLHVRCADFLNLTPADFPGEGFDRVLMNPPFERGIDLHHVKHAFTFLRPGGCLVAVVCSPTGQKLREWADDCSGWVEPLPHDTFRNSERPTGVQTSLVVARRLNTSTV